MNTYFSTNRKFMRMLGNILSIFVILAMAFPATGSASAEETIPFSGRDEFNGPLAEGWYWVNENPNKWNMTENPGFLRIYASPAGAGSENLLLRPVTEGDFTIKTHLLFEPYTNFQFAGLVIWQDEYNFLQLGRAFCDVEGACVGNGLYFDRAEGGNSVDGNFATPVGNPSDVFLRLERRGGMVRAFYSLDEQISWYEIGTHWLPGGFQVNGVGLTASQDFNDLNIPADFDFFELNEGSGFLPEGFHDYDQGDVPIWACSAGGWAADPDDPAADVNVEIVVDDQTVTTLPAAEFRQDLLDAGVCVDGNCSFSTGLWGAISPSEPHRVDAWAQDTSSGEWVLLSNSAKTLTCRTHDIYTFEPATGQIQPVTNLPDTHEYNPRWSPDGKKIVHDVWDTDWNWHQVHITDVKTGVSTPLLGAEYGSYPTWSPSGKWIAFDRENNLFIVPAAGGTAQLVRNDAILAAWSPNSQRLVFHQPSDGSIRTVELKGGAETLISRGGNAPAWSPDGEWIAYQKDGNIWKVKVNSKGSPVGDATQLTSSPIFEDRPTWSNNSRTIAYHAGMTGDFDIWTVPAAGGMPTWLNGAPIYGDYDPNYSFNGRFISYSSFSPDGQAPRQWGAAFSYDVGTWTEGDHAYHLENTFSVPESGGEILPTVPFNVSPGASTYNSYVLLRGYALRARLGSGCPAIESVITPEQNTRFHYGWETNVEMTYAEATAHFNSMSVNVYWDDGISAELQRHEIFPWSSVNWDDYVCAATEAPREPVLYIHYEYPDVVEGDYELGHTIQVTVFDSDGNTKATATVETMEMPHWGGAPGFRVEQWDGMEDPPDIQPGDVVRAVVDGGPLTVETRIGEIIATIDLEANSITGTINAPWAGDSVDVLCMAWGAPQGAPDKETTVVPDGISEFACIWDPSEWDIQPGESGGVAYWGTSLHSIANTAPNPWIMAFPEANQVFGYGWPVESEVSLTINDEDIATVTVQGAPWDQNDIMAFFDFGAMHDLVAGDVVKLSGSGMERTHIVQNLTVTDTNMEADTVSGTADNGASVHAWVHEFGRDVQIDVTDGSWEAYFGGDDFHLQPGMCGRAEIRVEGNNSTNVDWCIPRPEIRAWLGNQRVEGYQWTVGEGVSLEIYDPISGNTFTDAQQVVANEWGSFVGFSMNGWELQPGQEITMTSGAVVKQHTILPVSISSVDTELNGVEGTASNNGRILLCLYDGGCEPPSEVWADGSGYWQINYGDQFDIRPGFGMDATEFDDDGDGTSFDYWIPNPRIVVQITDNWFRAESFTPNGELTFWVYEFEGGTLLRHPENTWQLDDSGGVTIGMWELDEYLDLVPGNYLVASDGTRTRELVLEAFTFDVFDSTIGHLEGTAPEPFGRTVWVGIGLENDAWIMEVTTDPNGNWSADFGTSVPSDYQWVAAQIFDADGDASELRPTSQIIFLRPSCGDTYTAQAGSSLEIRYGSWIAIGEDLANQNAEHLTVNLVLNDETVTGVQQPVVPGSEFPCSAPPEDAYGVFYVTQVAPLSPGTYVAEVTWSLDAPVTDGYDANGDGEPDWYGPGEVFTHEFTIIVQ